MTTKAERIRQLLDAGMCNTMIAELVGCREEYVRVVKQRLCPLRRQQDEAYRKALQDTCNRQVHARAGAIAYREAIKAGAGITKASRLCALAQRQIIYATGDHAAARAAYHAAKRGTSHA